MERARGLDDEEMANGKFGGSGWYTLGRERASLLLIIVLAMKSFNNLCCPLFITGKPILAGRVPLQD